MQRKSVFFGILIISLIFGFNFHIYANPLIIPDRLQGTFNVFGYNHHIGDGPIIPWVGLTDPSFDSLRASSPTTFILTPNMLIIIGGAFNAQSFPARVEGNTLYAVMGGNEVVFGYFDSEDFQMTFGLMFAPQGAFVLFIK